MTLLVRIPEGRVAETLNVEAEKRACRSDQLAVALISCALDGNLVDAILDDVDPSKIVGVRPRRSSLQIRVMRALPAFQAPNGTIVASSSAVPLDWIPSIAARSGTRS